MNKKVVSAKLLKSTGHRPYTAFGENGCFRVAADKGCFHVAAKAKWPQIDLIMFSVIKVVSGISLGQVADFDTLSKYCYRKKSLEKIFYQDNSLRSHLFRKKICSTKCLKRPETKQRCAHIPQPFQNFEGTLSISDFGGIVGARNKFRLPRGQMATSEFGVKSNIQEQKSNGLTANTELDLNRSIQEQNTNSLTANSGLLSHHLIKEHSKDDSLSANTNLGLNRSIQEQTTNDLTASSGLLIHHFIEEHSKDDGPSVNTDLDLNRSVQEQNTNDLTTSSGLPIHHFMEEHSKDDRPSANTDLGLNRCIQEQNTNDFTANSAFPIHHYGKFGLNGNIQEQSMNSSTENSVTNCLIAKNGGLQLSLSVQGLNNTHSNVSDLNSHFQDLNKDHSMANNIQTPNGKVCLELFPQRSGLVPSISMEEVPKKGNFRSATDPKTAQITISCAEKVLEFDHFPVDSVQEVMLFVKKAISSQNPSGLASTLENKKKVSAGSDLIPKFEHPPQPLDQANDSEKRFLSNSSQTLKRTRDFSPANSNHVNQEAMGDQPPRKIIRTGTQSSRTLGSCMRHPPIRTQTKIIEGGKGKVIWSRSKHKVFVKLCLDEVKNGNRSTLNFNKIGWKNIIEGFFNKTNTRYGQKQMMNHFNETKAQWLSWQKLINHTGFLMDPVTKTITADEETWADFIQANPDAANFRKNPLPHANDLDIIYGGTAAAGGGHPAFDCDPTFEEKPLHTDGCENKESAPVTLLQPQPSHIDTTPGQEDIEGVDTEEFERQQKRRCNGDESSQHRQKGTTAERVYNKILLEIHEAFRSTSSVTRRSTPSVGDCISVLNETLNLEKGGDLYMFATHLFIKSGELRETWMALDSPERVKWLEYMKKHYV